MGHVGNDGDIEPTPANRAEVRKTIIASTVVSLVLPAAFFLSAGRIDLPMGWAYAALIGVNTLALSLLMDPHLLAERSAVKEGVKRWDIPLAVVMGRLGPLAIVIVAGLDIRYGRCPPVSVAVQIAAYSVAALGMAFTDWAVLANPFFAGVVRIQRERGHTTVSGGPYGWVRHPGYVGSLVHYLAVPVMLGALWALVPAGLTSLVIIVRTALEDSTLLQELDGYREYAARIRYRLLPGLW